MSWLSGQSVLIVEDDAFVAMLLDDLMRDAGALTLGPVYTVEDALILLRSIRPDAAILDLNLCGKSATPVAADLAARDVPFVVVTGYADIEVLPQQPRIPVVAKPVAPSVLIDALTELLSSRGMTLSA